MSAIGYVLVSHTYKTSWRSCGLIGCGTSPVTGCPYPETPACHARCVHHHEELEKHPECQDWQRRYNGWYEAHHHEEATATRLGPLHYFRECKTLTHRGPRRADAEIVALDAETAKMFRLTMCKECAAKMAPFEKQFPNVERAEPVEDATLTEAETK